MHIIGVDVGGTNTDAVLIHISPDQGKAPEVVTTNKTTTTADVFSGVIHAVRQVLTVTDVAAIMIGTTHFINALIQRRNLAKVCILRLCGPATHSLPPMSNWPDDLIVQVNGLTACTSGGYFYDGNPISEIDEEEIRRLVRQALDLHIHSFCVSGVFSPCRSDQEERVAEIIRGERPDALITLSHQVAGLGLFERENVSILNACLRPLALRTLKALETSLPFEIPVFLTQNNGTLLSLEQCGRLPILTFASGATNSMIGAAHLTGIENGLVIDIGGTSTDIGVLINGRPRHTHAKMKLVDDIRVNMSMPDILSLPLGGGTIVHTDDAKRIKQIGPDSVGYRLQEQALAFGGQVITATDIAIAGRFIFEGDRNEGDPLQIGHTTVKLPKSMVDEALSLFKRTITDGVDRMKTSKESIPVIVCGGGSILIDSQQQFTGVTRMIRPAHYAVCNAVGAALCSVSGTVESIVDLIPSTVDGGEQRQRELNRLMVAVRQQCEQNGAHPSSIRVAEIEQIPLTYYPGGYRHRVLLTAIGQLDMTKLKGEKSTSSEKKVVPLDIVEEPAHIAKAPIFINMANKRAIFDERGVWRIDPIDIEYIAYGAGILGCGGGGDPYHSKLSCLELLRRDKDCMRVVPPTSLDRSADLAAVVGFMGAPTVSQEQLPNGQECAQAIDAIAHHLQKRIIAVFCGEVGGANGLRGLLVGAVKGLPCVDCDGMGRAFPRLDQKLAFIRGQPATPTCLCDVRGRTVVYTAEMISNPQQLEANLRQECIKMGLRGALCFPPLTGEQVQHYSIHHSLSRAWLLGRAKFTHPTEAIRAVAEAGQGRILVNDGKVVGVERYTTTGFARGHVKIETARRLLTVDFQNENLIARFDDGEVLASVPDLITLVEQDSGEPLSTETVKYGCRVSVLLLPAPDAMTTEEALKHVGPKAFGYEGHEYKPMANLTPLKSVWDLFGNAKND